MTASSTSPRLRGRRRERGAALVEAIVVVPTFIILLLGVLFLHGVIAGKLAMLTNARQRAWSSAMVSCTGDGAGVPQPQFSSTLPGSKENGALQDTMGTSKGSDNTTVQVGAGASVPFSAVVSSNVSVLCNNQTEPGDIADVFRWVIHNVQFGI